MSSIDSQRACYAEYLKNHPAFKVSFIAVLTLNNNGVVENVVIDQKLQHKIENCIKYSLFSLSFPISSNRKAKTIEIKQSFNLMPKL
jgi:hypothetical protein